LQRLSVRPDREVTGAEQAADAAHVKFRGACLPHARPPN
jgi:hypothetical protein